MGLLSHIEAKILYHNVYVYMYIRPHHTNKITVSNDTTSPQGKPTEWSIK